jgi:hypothetical protein
MAQVQGTFSLTWSEIHSLDLQTFDDFIERKSDAIDDIKQNAKGKR